MALSACILVKTVPTQSDAVLEAASKLKGITKAFIAFGRFDLVVFAKCPDYSAIRKLASSVNALDGVRSTETLVEA